MFYVYEWFIKQTNEVFYVGKGCNKRYKVRKHNKFFNEFIKRYDCDSRIVREFDVEQDAFAYEHERICELKKLGQCVCNIYDGGAGGTASWWTDERRIEYSHNNVMKSEQQRKRMSENNPMKNKDIAKKVSNYNRRPIIIGSTEYKTITYAASQYATKTHEIYKWVHLGKTPNGEDCFYKDGINGIIREKRHIVRTKPTCKKPVIVDGKYFDTKLEGSKYLGIAISTFNIWIKQPQPYRGHICEYANQQPSRRNTINSTTEGSTTNE